MNNHLVSRRGMVLAVGTGMAGIFLAGCGNKASTPSPQLSLSPAAEPVKDATAQPQTSQPPVGQPANPAAAGVQSGERGPGELTAEVDHQAYWYSRYNLNAMLLMAAVGLQLTPPADKVKALADIAQFDLSQLPKNPYLLRAVYAGGDPHFQQPGDFKDLATLRWNRDKMLKRFEPAAQAFSVVKTVARGLRTDYNRYGKDKFFALVQLQEAKAMADFLATQLTRGDGLLAARPEGGELEQPQPYDQASGLWAYSSLSLALTNPYLPVYRQLPDSPAEAQKSLSRADALFKAMAGLQPQSVRDLSLTIEAYGWYGVASQDAKLRAEALARVAQLGQRLADAPKAALNELGFAIYGLGEAARLLKQTPLAEAAQRLFFSDLERLWDGKAGVYAPQAGVSRYVYTPELVASVLAGTHAIRWFHRPGAGSGWDPALPDQRYLSFFQNAVVKSGLQQAHAISLAVAPEYLQGEPRSYFTAPTVPLSTEGDKPYGTCPMYAAEAVFENGTWRVTDRTFRTADGMLLSTISTWLHSATPDGFLPL